METTKTLRFFEVGGCLRDEFLGIPTKDVDFAVEAPSFATMHNELDAMGFKIFQVREEFLTIRAGVPKNHPLRERTKDADFVMCRKDSETSDGRRPDFVTPGTLFDDLARRDFTVNAIARAEDGTIIDPHGGLNDLAVGRLRFVGLPLQRIQEDGLRVLRGFRFIITKRLTAFQSTKMALESDLAAEMLAGVAIERVRDELEKMFRHDTVQSLNLISRLPPNTKRAIFRDGLHLMPTLKK